MYKEISEPAIWPRISRSVFRKNDGVRSMRARTYTTIRPRAHIHHVQGLRRTPWFLGHEIVPRPADKLSTRRFTPGRGRRMNPGAGATSLNKQNLTQTRIQGFCSFFVGVQRDTSPPAGAGTLSLRVRGYASSPVAARRTSWAVPFCCVPGGCCIIFRWLVSPEESKKVHGQWLEGFRLGKVRASRMVWQISVSP